jgi:hypothetical protein
VPEGRRDRGSHLEAGGTVGEVFAASAAFMPPPPDFASPPILWGTEGYVREMFGMRHSATIEWESVEAFADFFMERFGPMRTATQMLGERFGELRERVVGVWQEATEARDGRLVLPQEYLLSVIRL